MKGRLFIIFSTGVRKAARSFIHARMGLIATPTPFGGNVISTIGVNRSAI
jgi:hypothetical protein